MVVCRAAQEAGAPHHEYIYRKKENIIFIPLYLGDPLSNWNQICYRVARQPREVYIPTWKEIAPAVSEIRAAKVSIFFFVFFSFSSSFHTLAKIAINANAYSDHLEIRHTER